MGVRRVAAGDAIAALERFSAVIDARSPSEFADDHLPGAQNWPTLDDAQRAQIGTAYAQASPFDARKRGAAMAARNIAEHLDRHAAGLPRGWRPLVYCWRGGQRSGALATILGAVGFDVSVLDGGYRAFRRDVIAELADAGAGMDLRVLCGPTGCGKSRLLQALAAAGAQVLDLEQLAQHRGSVLGALPDAAQPSQKRFETRVWQALRGLDRTRAVYLESESRLIGRLRVPEALLQRMRAGRCLRISLPIEARVRLLMAEYAHFVADTQALCVRLDGLRELRGAAVVTRWQGLARSGHIAELVRELLEQHYDPTYRRSMNAHYAALNEAPELSLADEHADTFAAAAQRIGGRSAASDRGGDLDR